MTGVDGAAARRLAGDEEARGRVQAAVGPGEFGAGAGEEERARADPLAAVAGQDAGDRRGVAAGERAAGECGEWAAEAAGR